MPTSCHLQYLVKGVNAEREDKFSLRQEIVDGFSLDLEFADIEPFSKASFEPYLAEQVLLELINRKCQTIGSVSLQLMHSEFN